MPSSEPPSPSIALFDLDHTLLAGDSNALWLGFLAERGLIDGAAIMERQARYLTDYTAGRLDILAYLEFQLEPLAGRTLESLNPLLETFSATQLAPRIAPGAASLIAHHRAQGHRCAIVSATHRFLAGPSANMLGIDTLLCTEAEVIDGRFTGRISGEPCFRERKIGHVLNWLATLGANPTEVLPHTWFYSDSANDLPLLEAVGYPVAVDADARLYAVTDERGWQRISLRHPAAFTARPTATFTGRGTTSRPSLCTTAVNDQGDNRGNGSILRSAPNGKTAS